MRAAPTRSAGRSLALIALVAGLSAAPAFADEARPPMPVAAAKVEMREAAVVGEAYAGVVTPRRESRLGFETGGRVAVIAVDVGDEVVEGAELARLDLRTLDAQIAAAEASVVEAEASLRLARATAERQRELVDGGHASRQRLDEVDANVDVSRARVGAARAELDALIVRRDLSILTAPFAGIVTDRLLDEGTIAGPGVGVVDLVESGALEVRVGLPVEQAQSLIVGEVYRFHVRGAPVSARLRSVTGVVERATQTVAAVFHVLEDGASRPAAGEVARLTLEKPLDEPGFWVPVTALAEGRRGLWNVLALEPDPDEPGVYRLAPRLVDVIHTEADRAYARGAVAHGELIVTAGVERVVPGQRVRPADGAASARNQLADAAH
ncbi:MAG: efflux RND transporter periplasmic adaptor subunit [Caulobacterales bacterium]|nr:efflux RND transporter periplasmic adaptor subunit [Caulobacterales bacterium]